LRDLDKKFEQKYVGLAYDACCTWEGNSDSIVPKADIIMAFARHIFADKACLWATFCLRNSRTTGSQIEKFIKRCALYYDYEITDAYTWNYQSETGAFMLGTEFHIVRSGHQKKRGTKRYHSNEFSLLESARKNLKQRRD